MRREDLDLRTVKPDEFPEPGMVAEPQRPVDLGAQLHQIEQRVRPGIGRIDLAVVELRVTRMQQPAGPRVHRHATVTPSVAAQRNQQDLR